MVDLPLIYQGKVRDIYAVGDQHLLLIASDRLSAFDVVMNEPIPHKGRVLTGLTQHWLSRFPEVPRSLVSCDPAEIASFVPGFMSQHAWHGRSMLVRKAEMLPLECIVRARLAGQAFDEYEQHGTVHAMAVPAGLRLSDAFDEPLFTPSTKAAEGHDLNIDLRTAQNLVGEDNLAVAMNLSLTLFRGAAAALAERGLVLADTKFELGFVDGQLVVCDEVVTPDSSRIWPADGVSSGVTPPSFDKQPFRDWLSAQSWDRTPPPPRVPDDIVAVTANRYVACYERVTGHALSDWYGGDL
jgi:phosphoribosylaminoimidazole-succinocarboxamide synthase